MAKREYVILVYKKMYYASKPEYKIYINVLHMYHILYFRIDSIPVFMAWLVAYHMLSHLVCIMWYIKGKPHDHLVCLLAMWYMPLKEITSI